MNSSTSVAHCLTFVSLLVVTGVLSGCATTYESACHELSDTRRRELNTMERAASNAQFERHVVLIETGTGMQTACRSYYIDDDQHRGIPASLTELCDAQANGSEYCELYFLDGEVLEQRIR